MSMTREDMMAYAADVGELREEHTLIEEFEWEQVDDFPVDDLLKVMSQIDWQQWWEEELDNEENYCDGDGRWSRLATEEIQNPIVIVQREDGSYYIWDGWHRSAAAVVSEKETIKAVFGKHYTLTADLDEASRMCL